MNLNTLTNTVFENIVCKSASVAASYALGRKARYDLWIDELSGDRLEDVYSAFATEKTEILEEASYPKKVMPQELVIQFDEEKRTTHNVADTKAKNEETRTVPANSKASVTEELCVFHVRKAGVYKASGYFDQEENSFYLMRGSFFKKEISKNAINTSLGEAQDKFIQTYCRDIGPFYLVTKNIKLLPSLAASYIVGENKDLDEWINDDGKHLYEVLPYVFSCPQKQKTSPQKQKREAPSDNIVKLYLKKDSVKYRSCDAIAKYNVANGTIVIEKGSKICLNVANSFLYTTANVKRQGIISSYCTRRNDFVELKTDLHFETPSAAASFVIGCSVNGLAFWKNKDGRSLKEILNDIKV